MVFDKDVIIVFFKEVFIFDFNDFVKVIEEEFDVFVVVLVVVVGVVGGEVVVKDSFIVEFIFVGFVKVKVIKVVKDIIGFGLKDVKVFVDGVFFNVKEDVKEDEVNDIKVKFEEVGVFVIFK